MTHGRPDPEAILARLRLEERPRARGRLKVFFGATAGVGKTYAMLEEAQERRQEGADVVVGYVETHGRTETEALVEGLEVLPRRTLEYRGVRLPEFDLDAALERHPQLILVDELAHTNAEGSRHAKRWQDVEELLAAGVDVYTTLNVQHIESVNDLVARVTGVRVRETVPDSVLERADELELIDLPPEELLKRLGEGKVYVPEQAQRAAESFFSKANLTALRQLALRTVAERVDTQMRVYRRAGAVRETWPLAERVLVGVGPAPSSQRLVRATKRMADRLGAEWIAAFVETPAYAGWSEADRGRVWDTLRLAEQLGARTVTLSGSDPVEEILSYARAQNVSKLVVGKPTHPRWRDRIFGSIVEAMARRSGDIDVYVIAAAEEEVGPAPRRPPPERPAWAGYLWAAAAVAACTALGMAMASRFERTNVAMVYLLAVVAIALRFGRGPSIFAAVFSVLAFDFMFVPPYYTFAVSDTQYLITFAVMLVVALAVGTLTVRMRRQAEASRQRERRTAALYQMGRGLVESTDSVQALDTGLRQIEEVFECRAVALLPDAAGQLRPWPATASGLPLDTRERGVADWVYANGRAAGAGTDTLPGAAALYLPLRASGRTLGVVGVIAKDPRRLRDPEQLHLLEAFVDQLAVAVERDRLAEEALRIRQLEEVNRLTSEFVAVASRELRSPLARLAAKLGRAREAAAAPEAALLDDASREADRLRAFARDLLDLSRLESGRFRLHPDGVSAAELVQRAAADVEPEAARRGVRIVTDLADDLPHVRADAVQIRRILSNLLSNALRYSPRGGEILLAADLIDGFVQVSVADTGAGIPVEDQARIFDKFVQVRRGGEAGGTGLGLAIAREILRAHGGTIWVDSGPGPATVFSFTIPVAPAGSA
ncbi:MAG TPA: sensor histidine kinase KdpD [Longimicrobiales bacterium]|nr:sensor histidine kinase KdpD [Longimicrobiales bacterium]